VKLSNHKLSTNEPRKQHFDEMQPVPSPLHIRHCEGKVIFDRIGRALEPACTAVPTLKGVEDDRFFLFVGPRKHVARTDLVAVAASDALII
jgi:hypothetical protein